jgi:glycine amidinotransferase
MISSHNGWNPLEEVWVGDTYPEHFYSHLPNKIQDSLGKITEWTKHDLGLLEKKLIDLGVVVRRPEFSNQVDDYIDYQDNLVKPPICPRDYVITIGDTLYVIPQGYNVEPWQSTIDLYTRSGGNVQVLNRFTEHPDILCYMTPPAVTRVGKDLFFEASESNFENKKSIAKYFQQKGYRTHLITTGGHNDGIFCPIRPGYIFSTHYFNGYEKSFPGWEVYFLNDTTTTREKFSPHDSGQKWWVPGIDNATFNDFIINSAPSWVGDFRETIFEVNMLIVDEKNLICINEDESALRKLESLGITPHVIDFRCRTFWDGGIHCLTNDIRRKGQCIDYWPDTLRPATQVY